MGAPNSLGQSRANPICFAGSVRMRTIDHFANRGVIMNRTCSRSLVAVVLGTMLLMRWGDTRAAEPPAAPAGDARQKLVGEWELDLPELSVTYEFGQDGKFTLLFDRPLGGSAGGTWKV